MTCAKNVGKSVGKCAKGPQHGNRCACVDVGGILVSVLVVLDDNKQIGTTTAGRPGFSQILAAARIIGPRNPAETQGQTEGTTLLYADNSVFVVRDARPPSALLDDHATATAPMNTTQTLTQRIVHQQGNWGEKYNPDTDTTYRAWRTKLLEGGKHREQNCASRTKLCRRVEFCAILHREQSCVGGWSFVL